MTSPYPIHRLTIASMARMLRNLGHFMDKAEKHAGDIPLDNYLQARLYPDMFNLLQQLQYACYLAADYARHFTDKPVPRVGYDETTWPELRKSVDQTVACLEGIAPAAVDAAAGKTLPTFMDDSKGMNAVDYGADVIMPDFHFHLVTAYALLRHNGVPLGKSDYFGKLEMKALPSS
jgi:uncharacterized protein